MALTGTPSEFARFAVARALHSKCSPTMRITTTLAYLVLFLPAIAGANPKPTALPELARAATAPAAARSLAPREVSAKIRPYDADIGRCYLDVAKDVRGAGHLDVELAIHRTGVVDRIDVSTPGLPARASKRIASCVQHVLASTTFPARRSSTIAVLPYYYQHVAAPGAGPQLSCWNSRGCR